MVFSFPAFFISEVNFFQILKFLPISTYTLYIVLARVHKISIFQSYLLIVFQNLFNYHSYCLLFKKHVLSHSTSYKVQGTRPDIAQSLILEQ